METEKDPRDGTRLITTEKEFKQFTAPGAKCSTCEDEVPLNHRVRMDGGIVPCRARGRRETTTEQE